MCTNPIRGWRSKKDELGKKRGVVYSLRQGNVDQPITVPCGQCMECRLKASREMAIRCMHEASLYEKNCVITLTYENLPIHYKEINQKIVQVEGSIDRTDPVAFIKRLRAYEQYKKAAGEGVETLFKTYGAAEYGEKKGRPHYHIILFGYDFEDKKPDPEYGPESGYYVSEKLDELWDKGRTQIMDLTFESAAYVARYVTKKLNISVGTKEQKKKEIEKIYGNKIPEQTICVSQKGIGKEWYNTWKTEIYNNDKVYRNTKDGKRIPMNPPKYYDRRYELEHNEKWKQIQKQRRMQKKEKIKKLDNEIKNGNYTNAYNVGCGSRDMAKNICNKASIKNLKRSYENG